MIITIPSYKSASQRFALQELLKQFFFEYRYCTSIFLFHKSAKPALALQKKKTILLVYRYCTSIFLFHKEKAFVLLNLYLAFSITKAFDEIFDYFLTEEMYFLNNFISSTSSDLLFKKPYCKQLLNLMPCLIIKIKLYFHPSLKKPLFPSAVSGLLSFLYFFIVYLFFTKSFYNSIFFFWNSDCHSFPIFANESFPIFYL